MAGWPRAERLNRIYSRGDVMTGAGRVSVIRDNIGYVLSGADSCLAVANAAGQPLPRSYCTPISRRTSRAASVFTIGIRGATPPPAD